jgi:hypothetical protein
MARKSQRKHQGPSPVGVHDSTQQASTTGNDQAEANEKAKGIVALVAPLFSFPFTATYPSELEISDSEDTLGITAETVTQTTAQDPKTLTHDNQTQYSHSPSSDYGSTVPTRKIQ